MKKVLNEIEQKRFDRIEKLTSLLDNSIKIPGTKWNIGIDPLLGLFPVAGDVISASLSLYIVFECYKIGIPQNLLMRMLANVAIDSLSGCIPLLGDIFDAAFKCNLRNLKLLKKHLSNDHAH